jgi:hypothetical protein
VYYWIFYSLVSLLTDFINSIACVANGIVLGICPRFYCTKRDDYISGATCDIVSYVHVVFFACHFCGSIFAWPYCLFYTIVLMPLKCSWHLSYR